MILLPWLFPKLCVKLTVSYFSAFFISNIFLCLWFEHTINGCPDFNSNAQKRPLSAQTHFVLTFLLTRLCRVGSKWEEVVASPWDCSSLSLIGPAWIIHLCLISLPHHSLVFLHKGRQGEYHLLDCGFPGLTKCGVIYKLWHNVKEHDSHITYISGIWILVVASVYNTHIQYPIHNIGTNIGTKVPIKWVVWIWIWHSVYCWSTEICNSASQMLLVMPTYTQHTHSHGCVYECIFIYLNFSELNLNMLLKFIRNHRLYNMIY